MNNPYLTHLPSITDDLQRLLIHIQSQNNPLLIATTPNLEQRVWVEAALAWELEKSCIILPYPLDHQSRLHQALAHPGPEPDQAYLLSLFLDLEHMGELDHDQIIQWLGQLNQSREALARHQRPVLLWMPDHFLQDFIAHAGDLWSWRSDHVTFDIEPDYTTKRFQAITTAIKTGGGAYIGGNVTVHGDFIARDKMDGNNALSPYDIAQARADYLNWLIERNQYLDARGVSQTQRQVQLKLDEIYIGLQAQADERPNQADRGLQEEELAALEARVAAQALSMEDAEDRRDALFYRLAARQEQPASQTPIPLTQATAQHRHLVILGDPGSGKTTLLRYLALQHAQATDQNLAQVQLADQQGKVTQEPSRFPILIRIADYAEEERWREMTLTEFLPSYFERNECQPSGLADLLNQELMQGGCQILLDGLDEIVSADDRRGIVHKIENFVRHHANGGQRGPNNFIITSRIAGYRSAPISDIGNEPFAHFVVQEMDETQMAHFLGRWCRAVEDAQTPDLSVEARQSTAQREVDDILGAIQNNPGVRRLAANPLMLRTLALIHRTGARLPQKRIELYRLAADTLARTWRTAQGVPESVLVEDHYLNPLLGQLAYWIHENKPTGIATEEEVYDQLGQAYSQLKRLPSWDPDNPDPEVYTEIKKFLQAVREHTGLFVERAPRRYGFMHLTFEEYYAARHLVARNRIRVQLIRQHLHQPRWQEPILLALGFVGLEYVYDAGELLDSAILAQGEDAEELGLTPSPYEALLGRDYLFALRCLGDQIPANPTTLKSLVNRLADELLHRQGPARFSAYRNRLNQLLPLLKGSPATIELLPMLLAGFQDDDSEVRSSTAASLGVLGEISSKVVNALITAIKDDNISVRTHAVSSLGMLGQASSEVTTALITVLKYADSDVRSRAATSLVILGQGSDEVITALITALKDDSRYVRFHAAAPLGVLGESSNEVINTLTAVLKDDSRYVRLNAASLGMLGKSSNEVIAVLIDVLKDDDWYVRSRAAAFLGVLGESSSEVINALIAATKDDHWKVRENSVSSLGILGKANSEVVSSLIIALWDDYLNVRELAAFSLGELGKSSSEVITALIATLRDDCREVRLSAAASLIKLGKTKSEISSVLTDDLNDDSWDVREYAAHLLGELGESNGEIITALIDILKEESRYVREHAAASLGKLGESSDEVIKALTTALRDRSWNVRSHAASALGELDESSSEVISALNFALKDDDRDVCERAATSLIKLGKVSNKVIATLIAALEDDHVDIRERAAVSLGGLDRPNSEVITALIAALKDGNSDVRSNVAISLAKLGSISQDKTITALLSVIDDSDYSHTIRFVERTGQDYAYDALWKIVVG